MKIKITTTVVSSMLLAACISAEAGSRHSHDGHQGKAEFEFALIGDTPYGVLPGTDYPQFERLTAEINRERKLRWVLHAGDIKAGSTPCSDAMFYDRLERYNQFRAPVILTLGDNEWTDCHRLAAGEYQTLERLDKLREVFYPEPGIVTLGGRSMRVNTQAEIPGYESFPENVWWQRHGVLFSAIHVVGSSNALAPFAEGSAAVRTEADDAEVAARIDAAVAMLDLVFAKAQAEDAPGVFIMIHANPGLERGQRGTEDREGFVEFLTALEQHTKAYDKPVVLAHGDSHYFRIDQPPLVNDGFIDNFTRVETYGSSHVHWIRVRVNPRSEQVFSFRQELVEGNGE